MLRKAVIRVIYAQGVEAVERTIRQLYEMIEVEDERVHQLVARATVAHLQKKCAYPAGVELRYRDEQTRLGDADENAPTRHQSRCGQSN